MTMGNQEAPWDFLQLYLERLFQREWPTIPQMPEIACERFGRKRALTGFEPSALSLSRQEVRAAARRAGGSRR